MELADAKTICKIGKLPLPLRFMYLLFLGVFKPVEFDRISGEIKQCTGDPAEWLTKKIREAKNDK